MTTLKDNINSEFLYAFAKLKSKKAPKTITVYVESDEDIAFWRNILYLYENKNIRFDIQLPSKTSLAKGKNKAIQRGCEIFNHLSINSLGDYLLICVDSDYDYLLQDYSKYSKIINDNDFIFQTYSYSIENLKCFSESLHNVCVSATLNDNIYLDFNELLKIYSNIIFKLFLWNLYFYKTGDFEKFTLTTFCETIKVLENPKIDEYGKNSLENIANRVNQKLDELETNFPDKITEIIKFGDSLKSYGLISENTYLFIQGHTIFDNVVLMFLKPQCNLLKSKKELIIKNLAKNKVEIEHNIKSYRNRVTDVKTILSNNTEFRQCFLYQKIKLDIERYIDRLIK